jgi:Phosphodiester glycosidase
VRLVRLSPPQPLGGWCQDNHVSDAITGGFFTRPECIPLGEHRIAGRAIEHRPFSPSWSAIRPCLHADEGRLVLAARHDLPLRPTGDLLQAGPMLVRDGFNALLDANDPEGFSADSHLFDEDITKGRLPRAALGLSQRRLIAVVADGRAKEDAGLSLPEFAEVLLELGAITAINLDGGASSALVADGRLQNRPRGSDGNQIPGGRPAPTALSLLPQSAAT